VDHEADDQEAPELKLADGERRTDRKPLAGLVLSAPHRVDRLVVGGRDVVRGGALLRADEAVIASEQRAQARRFAP
jgi:hypothetical protein